MSILVSPLSTAVTAVVSPPDALTTPQLVSEITDGEVLASDVQVDWIDQATEEVERRTGMRFLTTDFTDVLHGNGLRTIFTRRFPLIEVSSVQVDGQEIDPSVYFVNTRTGSITLRNGTFEEDLGNVEVVGKAGYKPIPALIQKIATLIVAKTALSAKNGPLVDNESIGNFTQTRTFKKLNDELDRAWEAWGRRFPIDFV